MPHVRGGRNAKKTAAIGLAVLGVAGLTTAAASQLNLQWTGAFQAAAVTVAADCQPTNETISVAFTDPLFTASGGNVAGAAWNVANLNFTNINAACATKSYQVAYSTDGSTWVQLGGAGTVASPVAPATTSTVSVALGSVDPQGIKKVSLAIYG
jgi:hypothetical protein